MRGISRQSCHSNNQNSMAGIFRFHARTVNHFQANSRTKEGMRLQRLSNWATRPLMNAFQLRALLMLPAEEHGGWEIRCLPKTGEFQVS